MRSTQPATTSGGLSVRSLVFPRVADLPGRPADQQQRPVPGELQAAGGDDLHQVADVRLAAVGSKPT